MILASSNFKVIKHTCCFRARVERNNVSYRMHIEWWFFHVADILHVEPLISAITSGPKMIEIFGKLEKLETQPLYTAIKISSKTVQATTSPAISLRII